MGFWKYLWKSTNLRVQIILLIGIGLLFILFVFSNPESKGFNSMWQNWMEPFLAFATIAIAFLIAYNEKRQDWENNLPKKLNASFVYINGENSDEEIYRVENAPLSGSDDIRQWGQQIGMQMNGDRLDFSGFKVEGPELRKDTNGADIMQYQLTVWLEKIKDNINKTAWKYGDNGKVVEKTPLSIQNH